MTDKLTTQLYFEIEAGGILPPTPDSYAEKVRKVEQDMIKLFGKYIRGIHESGYEQSPILPIVLRPLEIILSFCEEPPVDLVNKARDIEGIRNLYIISL